MFALLQASISIPEIRIPELDFPPPPPAKAQTEPQTLSHAEVQSRAEKNTIEHGTEPVYEALTEPCSKLF